MKTLIKLLLPALLLMPNIGLTQVLQIEKGVADLRTIRFADSGPLELNGEWELYMSQLLSPADLSGSADHARDYIDFPSPWSSSVGRQNFGFATYRLTAFVNGDQSLALQMPHCYSNYILWINGKIVSTNGVVASSPEKSVPQWLPKTFNIPNVKDTLTFVLQVSNFHHAIGGIRKPLVLGNSDELTIRNSIALTSNIVLIISLAAFFLIFLFLFLVYRSTSLILFAIMSLVWSIRAAFSNQYTSINYWPDFPWELAVKIEYITLFLIMIAAMLFIGSLFKEDVRRLFKYLFCGCNVIFICVTMLVDASLYTQFLPVYLAFAAVLILYIIYVLIRAVVYDRQGVWLIVSCVFIGVIVFSYDLISYQGFATFNPIITSLGYLGMFALMAIALLFQIGIFKRSSATNMLTYDDLYGGKNIR